MTALTITVPVQISVDAQYCHQCAWMENCPPGCRLFKVPLCLCLDGGPLRSEECLEAERKTKEAQ